MTPEYQEATNEYLRGQNVNPIVSRRRFPRLDVGFQLMGMASRAVYPPRGTRERDGRLCERDHGALQVIGSGNDS